MRKIKLKYESKYFSPMISYLIQKYNVAYGLYVLGGLLAAELFYKMYRKKKKEYDYII